ncbi:ATP-binding cassette domain-containing protein [Candidatus Poribacteria bacterium]|nr:ATP-binding cassette domain-containing protein [Candidatus Poribacteria bacterium]
MIKVEDIHLGFGDNKVLKGVNLEVELGQTLVIMGQSGSGKSLTLKLIIGLIKPDSGKIWIDDEEITGYTEKQLGEIRQKFGMVFQSAALFDSLTVGENVGFGLKRHTDLSKKEIEKIVAEKLEMVSLPGVEDVMPIDLSGGMKKRVSLARAISMDPEIVLYDEPTTGLDPVTADEINRLIVKLHDQIKVTSLVVTHDMQSAFYVATHMAMLNDGKIVAKGTPDEFTKSSEPFVKKFLSQLDRLVQTTENRTAINGK